MAKNGGKEHIIELWGHEFSLARNGLDETQVVPFVNELVSERDLLLQRMEHLSTLTKLAEKTIVEADRLAEENKKEAIDEAKAEAKAILAKADEQAQQMIEEKRTQIITIATEEAELIKANAKREAELLIEQERGKIQPEVRNVAQRLYGELLSQIEDLKQQVKTSEVEFEHKLSQSLEQANVVKIEAEGIPVESQQPNQTIDQAEASELEEKASPSADSQDKPTYDKEVELEILPPLDIKQIMGIMRHLDSLAEVENTELIPLTDRPSIIVSLREPLYLIELLKTLPEVADIQEVTAGEVTVNADAAHAEGTRRKIQITLSGNSVPDNAKEELNSKV